jgi:GT2 family glycosyltransferase
MILQANPRFDTAAEIENSRAFSIFGWENVRPIISLIDAKRIDVLRARIGVDIDLLLPRCEILNATLPRDLLQRKAYVDSRQHRRFNPVVRPAANNKRMMSSRIDPAPAVHHGEVKSCADALGVILATGAPILCVGEPSDVTSNSALGNHADFIEVVAPGEGIRIPTVSGLFRSSQESFAGWMATHEEAERATVGAFVLTRTAGLADVALLRHRVHPHHRILVEAGSPALIWLLAVWDGVIVRQGDLFVLSEPGSNFREPSTRRRLSDSEPWPRVSVVTVSYNQREYLEQCLRSVMDQRYPNLEYIVIDGGSTDGSADLLRDYQARYSCFSHLVIERDNGQSDGLNKGFRLATGEILTWVNSDDMLAPLSLKRAAMALRETGADIVAGTCKRIEGVAATPLYNHFAALPSLRPGAFELDLPLNWCDSWERGDWFFQPEVLFTRDIWERAGGYLKPHLFWAMDWDLWLRFALAGARVIRVPDVMGASRVHTSQKTTSEELYLWQIVGILREYDELLAALASGFSVVGSDR